VKLVDHGTQKPVANCALLLRVLKAERTSDGRGGAFREKAKRETMSLQQQQENLWPFNNYLSTQQPW